MGAHGALPKRDAERRRRNKRPGGTITVDFAEVATTKVEIPAPNTGWHHVAYQMYLSLAKSLQAKLYEPSDWALAYMLCDQLSEECRPRPVQNGTDAEGNPTFEVRRVPMPGTKLSSILKGFTTLLVTEGDRRRLQIETARADAADAAQDASVSDIAEKRRDLMG